MAKNKYEVVVDGEKHSPVFVRGDEHYVQDGQLEIRDESGVVLLVPSGRWSCLQRTGITEPSPETKFIQVHGPSAEGNEPVSIGLMTKFLQKKFAMRNGDVSVQLHGTQYTVNMKGKTFYVQLIQKSELPDDELQLRLAVDAAHFAGFVSK